MGMGKGKNELTRSRRGAGTQISAFSAMRLGLNCDLNPWRKSGFCGGIDFVVLNR
jgi:hypothetical protein